jgi:hypothetical protein
MNVIGDRSPTFFVRIVLASWGMLVSIPVVVPILPMSCESSMIYLPKIFSAADVKEDCDEQY